MSSVFVFIVATVVKSVAIVCELNGDVHVSQIGQNEISSFTILHLQNTKKGEEKQQKSHSNDTMPSKLIALPMPFTSQHSSFFFSLYLNKYNSYVPHTYSDHKYLYNFFPFCHVDVAFD